MKIWQWEILVTYKNLPKSQGFGGNLLYVFVENLEILLDIIGFFLYYWNLFRK